MTSAPARFAVAAGITALAVLVLAASWLTWRLSRVGPLELPWLVEPIESALGVGDDDVRVDVETVALAWPSRGSLPELVVFGLVLSRSDGTEIGRLPELSIRPSGRALLRGRLAVGGVGLSGIRLGFVRNADGRVSLGESSGEGGGPGGTLSPAMIALFGGEPDPDSPIADLRVVRIRGAEILLDDRVIDARWTLAGADVDLHRRPGGIEAAVRATLGLAMDAATARVPLEATARASTGAAGTAAAIEFEAHGSAGKLALADSKPVVLHSFATELRFGIDDATVDLRSLALETSAGDLAASGTLSFAGGRFSATTEGEVRRVPADRVGVFWPAPVARGARSWVTERLRDGIVPRAAFAIRHETKTAFRIEIDFAEMTLDYLAPLRPIRQASGGVLVTNDRLEVRLAGAVAGGLRLTGGALDAPLGEKPIPATVTVDVAGPAADLVAFLDEPPIAVASRYRIPSDLAGDAVARAEIRFPLSDGAREGLEIDASGTITGPDAEATIRTRIVRGGVESLAIDPLRYGRNRLSVHARPGDDGSFHFDLAGPSADLAPFLERVRQGGASAGESAPALEIEFDLERVLLHGEAEIGNARGDGRLADGRITALDARGISPGGGAATVHVTPSAIGRTITLSSERAGELLDALAILGHVEGGTLDFVAEVDDRTPSGKTTGHLDLRDFRVVRAPVLARILSVGSLDGIADLLRGDGLAFRQARLPFVWSAGRIELAGATAIGTIGLTADGVVDRERGRIDLRGEVIPAYTLNSALGSVPILGTLLAGDDGKSVFGIEYRARGSLEKPDVETNALAALAPRRLREMFLDPFRDG